MSAEGDFLVAVVADPKNPDKRALATWDIANIDGTKPLSASAVTPGNDKMGFVRVNALKAGKVLALASQAWTGSLSGCGEGRTTGATKTWRYKSFLTDKSIKDFDDVFASGRSLGVSAETLQCLEIAGDPTIIPLPLDPENVIVRRIDPTTLVANFSKVNLKTGKSDFLFRDIGDLSIGLIDRRDGTVRTKAKIDPKGNLNYNSEIYIRNADTGKYDLEAPLTVDLRTRNQMDIAGYDEETGKYFVITDKFSDHAAAYLYDARTDKLDAEPVFAHKDFDVGDVLLGQNKSNFGKLLGFTVLAADQEVYWVDPAMKSIQDGLNNSFKGQHVEIIDVTDDMNKVLFSVDSPRNPTAYYLFFNKTKILGVGGQRPWIKPETMGPRTLVYYDARDGLKIPGLLTLPPNFKKGDPAPPAIVLPHGGPWARDSIGWDVTGWTQFLATRGIAVLQPQYRGSTGWGHNLWLAGDAQWGLKMQDDNDDAANWMVKEGYAAQGRIGIFGYSYGGFAAFAASVRPGGPFKCAIAGAGVSNLTRIGDNWSESRQDRAYQGRTVKGMDPQQNVDKLAMPILIYHGDRDVRVPLFHATDFYNSVKSTNKAKLLVLKDMGHQLDKWTADNTRDSLKGIEDFLVNDCKL
jgi:dipeptidyl aminopeptidase/acylaminoacyl peptidase